MQVNIEGLVKAAAAGRGLWVGMTFTGGWSNDWSRFLPARPHLTLAHLGKQNDEARVVRLVEAVTNMVDTLELRGRAVVAELTGFGILYRASGRHTPIGLINSAEICRMRQVLISGIHDLVGDYFGFIPHVTLDNEKMESMGHGIHAAWTVLATGRTTKIMTWGPTIHCGDQTVLMNEPVF